MDADAAYRRRVVWRESAWPDARLRSLASEGALMEAAQAGSRPALERVVEENWADIHRAAYLITQDRAAAEDIAQETFLAAFDGLDGFDPRRPVQPWLRRIAINQALDYLRRPRRKLEISVDVVPEPADAPATEPELEAIHAALLTLEPEERALIIYRHLWGFRPVEIARVLGVAPGALRTRLHRALETLRRELAEQEG